MNLKSSKGKEKMADYLHKKTLGKKNKQPNGGAKEAKGKAKG